MAAQDDPTLLESIREAIDEKLFGLRTAVLCRVKTFKNSPRPMVSVQVAARKWKREGNEIVFTPDTELVDVPVTELAWGPFVIRAQLEPGDFGVLLICDRDIDEWLTQAGGNSKGEYSPGIAIIHDLSDAIFMPVIQPDLQASTGPTVAQRELFIGTRTGATAIRLNATTGKVSLHTPGLVGGPYNIVGVSPAGVPTHIATAAPGGGPVVWTDNPAAGVKGAELK